MYIKITSRSGHFNMLDSRDESIQTHIKVFDKGKELFDAWIETEYELDTNVSCDEIVDYCIYEIEKWDKRTFFSSSRAKAKECLQFIKDHRTELEKGNKELEITILEERKKRLLNDVSNINSRLEILKK